MAAGVLWNMKPMITSMRILSCPAVFACLSCAAMAADEIHLNPVETPDQACAYFVDDMDNSGNVSGPQEKIALMNESSLGFEVGELGTATIPGRVRKEFLLFHLPALEGKKLTNATLRLCLAQVRHEAVEKPLPPAWLLHANTWLDEQWSSDSRWHGLQTSHFADQKIFSEKIPLCGPDDKIGTIELDVTGMIQADYQRKNEPVAAFRTEISDREGFDITDNLENHYVFYGTGVKHADKAPTLILTLE